MRAILTAALGLFLSLFWASFLPVSAFAGSPNQKIVTTKDSDYFGFDLLTEKDVSLEQCKASCLGNQACKAFTYNVSAQFCFLKKDFRKLNSFSGAIAGKVVTVGDEPDLGAPPKLSFVQDTLIHKANKFRQGIIIANKLQSRLGVGALLMIARENLHTGNFKFAAEKFLSVLAVTPEDPKIWLDLAWVALKHKPSKSSQKRLFRDIAVTASLNGYKFSRTRKVRARALSSLAQGLKLRRQYRDAMKSYKASLALWELVSVRHAYDHLRITRGFRILKHDVDSESRDPRICIQFSEPLDKNFKDYERFILVNQKAPKAIDVRKNQICVEGLQHSNRYQIQVRAGLPSSIKEVLLSETKLNIYIRDRSPTLRFTGNSFVLPYAGRHGIPFVSVNTKSADLKLYRVGERALAQLLQGDSFLSQLGSYDLDSITNDLGAPIWSGSVSIKPELNKEVTTSIPVDDALPQRKPGVYVISAAAQVNSNDRVTQWFVISDIGLTTFSGSSKLQVFTRSLSTAKPMADVEVMLLARNNEVLGTTKTNALGQAEFDAGLTRGKGGAFTGAHFSQTRER